MRHRCTESRCQSPASPSSTPASSLLPLRASSGLFLTFLGILAIIMLSTTTTTVQARFYYKDFRDLSHLHLLGSSFAHKDSDPPCVALTYNDAARQSGNQTGAIWYERKINMRDNAKVGSNQGPDGFVTSFHFRMTPNAPPVNLTDYYQQLEKRKQDAAEGVIHPDMDKDPNSVFTDGLPAGGDGFAFIFRSTPSEEAEEEIGRGGSGIGYADLSGVGIAVEFDSRMNLDERDPNANHVSVHIHSHEEGGPLSSFESDDTKVVPLSFETLPLRRARVISSRRKKVYVSNKPLLVQIAYAPHLKTLKVFVEDVVSPVLVVKDVPVMTGSFRVGFTAATSGDSMDTHEICQWYFEKQRVVSQKSQHLITPSTQGKNSVSNGASSSSMSTSSAPPTQEKCDPGFTGPSCTLDLSALATTCLYATRDGCGGCIGHPSGHCQWCASQQRCISNELMTRFMDMTQHKPYCSDPASVVEDADECAEAPKYVMWGATVVLLVIIVCTVIALTGNLWLKSRNNATLVQDIATLIFYTLLGSVSSIFMTSINNLVLTEITVSADQSACYSLTLFLFLFGALLVRDIFAFRHHADGSRSFSGRGGGGGRGGTHPINYNETLNLDESSANHAILNAFETQQKGMHTHASPGAIRHHSSMSSSIGSNYASHASQRLFHSLTSVQGMMFVPICFTVQIGISVLLAIVVLEREWTSNYAPQIKMCFYCMWSISILFTLAYLFITFWRLIKTIFHVIWANTCAKLCYSFMSPRTFTTGKSRYSGRGGGSSLNSSSSSEQDLGELLSEFASSSLIRSVAQVRIMALCAIISGVYFGYMFGSLDQEDTTKSHLDLVVQRENYYSYPLAAFLGAMSSFTNQYLELYRVTNQEAVYVYDMQDDL